MHVSCMYVCMCVCVCMDVCVVYASVCVCVCSVCMSATQVSADGGFLRHPTALPRCAALRRAAPTDAPRYRWGVVGTVLSVAERGGLFFLFLFFSFSLFFFRAADGSVGSAPFLPCAFLAPSGPLRGGGACTLNLRTPKTRAVMIAPRRRWMWKGLRRGGRGDAALAAEGTYWIYSTLSTLLYIFICLQLYGQEGAEILPSPRQSTRSSAAQRAEHDGRWMDGWNGWMDGIELRLWITALLPLVDARMYVQLPLDWSVMPST
ncbi:hypothetical protein EV426DRAFT_349005 [Tirmania nivea]|nr:hypothetical protein EV426DRAFT_349005 [Tirmania nivea]